MIVKKLGISLEEQAGMELANSIAAQMKATQDYNIMMGNLEDPSEEEGEEDE